MFTQKANQPSWLNKLAVGAIVATYAFSSQAQLLGVNPEEPKFNYNSGGTTVFTAGTGALAVNATPLDFTPAGGTLSVIYPLGTSPTVIANLSLDTSCGLVSGDLGGDDITVSGDVDLNGDFVPEYTGVLLTGEVIAFGADESPSSTVALFDARFVVTGGALVDSGDYVAGAHVGVTLNVESSNFTGDCSVDWAGGAKGKIGSVEFVDPEPPVEACFDVKKVSIRDGKKHFRHWGSHGKSGSKVKTSVSTSCPANFDPTQELIALTLDGESFTFNPGSFSQIGSKNKYRAWLGGSPSLHAVLDCDKGKFGFNASRADVSQVDNSDGVDVTLELGTQVTSANIALNESGHHWWNRGHNNVLFYKNRDATFCGVEETETDYEEVKCRHKHTGKIFSFSKSKYNLGKSFSTHDSSTGHHAVFDTSKSSTLACGDEDENGNWTIVGVSHKDGGRDCTDLSEEDEDNDSEDNVHD